jgi:glutamine synthetase
MATNLHQFAKKNGVKYFFVSFVDLFGVLRSKLVPATAIDEIQSEGAGFAGFATWLDMSPADSDMFGIPMEIVLFNSLGIKKLLGWPLTYIWMASP